ncbi:PadR family transcriptional regulator [Actinoplanes sp. NPDC048796]|uniref:PadR family transcriptional regulator n=1 Tax=unclassified Actinoplanes TaxID=2626549 RepID=UPI0033C00DB0
MNSTRLFILSALAKGGPMYGHQIRLAAQVDRTDLWTDIKAGSLYGALHRMENDQVIEAVRTEQAGNRPARTVYALTDIGRREFEAQRDEALRECRLTPDPVDLALQSTFDMPAELLRAMVEDRLRTVRATIESWKSLHAAAEPYIRGLEVLSFRHTELRLEAELKWHEELLAALGE